MKIKRLPRSENSGASAPEGEMEFLEHLGELRTRLIRCLIGVIGASIVSYCYSQELFALLSAPFYAAFTDHQLIGTAPAEAFVLKLKVAFFSGVVLAAPLIFYEFWKFIAPGLHQAERRLALPFILSTTALFLIGITFCYAVVLPFAFEFFLAQYRSIGTSPFVRASEYLSLVTQSLLCFGIVFEMPVLAFFLGRLGIITDQMLISGTRYAIVAIFILAAVLTPPDVLTQFLLAGPLLLLYGLSILIVRYSGPKQDGE